MNGGISTQGEGSREKLDVVLFFSSVCAHLRSKVSKTCTHSPHDVEAASHQSSLRFWGISGDGEWGILLSDGLADLIAFVHPFAQDSHIL